MSLFKNTKDQALNFELGERLYTVPAGEEVEIPTRIAYAVKGMGLPLELVGGEEKEEVASDDRPSDPTARLWFDRAHEVRAAFEMYRADAAKEREALGADLEAAHLRIAELEEAATKPSPKPAKAKTLPDAPSAPPPDAPPPAP